ncbi:MAG: peptidylprolyl isomerase [Candidatus Omnitrophica bacterium]|nr:peptidylprolyl isomerase [Candidatus Omnitrophota bacterium]
MTRSRLLALLVMLVTGHWSLVTAVHAATNRIVAIVNDDVITEGDVIAHMAALFQRGDLPRPTDEEAQGMRRAVLQRLIEERLIVQEGKRLGLTVDPAEVTKRLQDIRAQLGSKEAYEQMLQEAQLGEEQLKIKLREQLMAQNTIDRQVRSKILISPAELASAAETPALPGNPGEEVLASHLLIRLGDERSGEEAETLIRQLRERLQRGADFSELAKQYSEGPHAEEGGSLGWVRPGELRPELEAALFSLQAGEVSEPIRSPLGVHLLKVFDRRSLSERELAEGRDRLERRLYQEKFVAALERWLADLRQRAYIQVMDEE